MRSFDPPVYRKARDLKVGDVIVWFSEVAVFSPPTPAGDSEVSVTVLDEFGRTFERTVGGEVSFEVGEPEAPDRSPLNLGYRKQPRRDG